MSVDPYEPLRFLMDKHGASGDPRVFYWAVNSAYHSAEAACYDRLHADMYQELPRVWRKLLDALPAAPRKLRVLDVGSGTGLVGEFLGDLCPDRIGSLTLLEPCEAMMVHARRKAAGWPFEVEYVLGDFSAVGEESRFDVVTVNSVLHHVVDLRDFCERAQSALRHGGVLLTAQDGRAEVLSDPEFSARRDQVKTSRPIGPRSLVGRAIRRVYPGFRPNPVARQTNAALLREDRIGKPMSIEAIWAVTDFHVPGQPGMFGRGISLADLREYMDRMSLVCSGTYHFFGASWNTLTEAQRRNEMELWETGDPSGELFCSAWRRG